MLVNDLKKNLFQARCNVVERSNLTLEPHPLFESLTQCIPARLWSELVQVSYTDCKAAATSRYDT